MTGRILAIGASDNTGAGGVQGDCKTATALGGEAACAVTCLTVQDDDAIRMVEAVAPGLIQDQIRAALDGRGVDAVKIGLLPDLATVDAVAEVLRPLPLPLVVEAAVRGRDGALLVDDATIAQLKRRLYDRARVLVASLPDAGALSGMEIVTGDHRRTAAEMLQTIGAETVILTDVDGPGDSISDLVSGIGGTTQPLSYPRPRGRRVRGVTGALAAAITTFIARGSDRASAIQHARSYLAGAVAHAPDTGRSTDPVHHGYLALFEPLQRG